MGRTCLRRVRTLPPRSTRGAPSPRTARPGREGATNYTSIYTFCSIHTFYSISSPIYSFCSISSHAPPSNDSRPSFPQRSGHSCAIGFWRPGPGLTTALTARSQLSLTYSDRARTLRRCVPPVRPYSAAPRAELLARARASHIIRGQSKIVVSRHDRGALNWCSVCWENPEIRK